jgi:hypothetical protein
VAGSTDRRNTFCELLSWGLKEQGAAFQRSLQQLSWGEGRDVRIDTRWGENNADLVRKYAAELVSLAPDVILAVGTLGAMAVQHLTRTLPIVSNGCQWTDKDKHPRLRASPPTLRSSGRP